MSVRTQGSNIMDTTSNANMRSFDIETRLLILDRIESNPLVSHIS